MVLIFLGGTQAREGERGINPETFLPLLIYIYYIFVCVCVCVCVYVCVCVCVCVIAIACRMMLSVK